MNKLLTASLALTATAMLGNTAYSAVKTNALQAEAKYYPSTLNIEYISGDRYASLNTDYIDLVTLDNQNQGNGTVYQWNNDGSHPVLIAVKTAIFSRTQGNDTTGTYQLTSCTLITSTSNPSVNFDRLTQTQSNTPPYSTYPMGSPFVFMYGSINNTTAYYWAGEYPPYDWNYNGVHIEGNVKYNLLTGNSGYPIYQMDIPAQAGQTTVWNFNINSKLGECLLRTAYNLAQTIPSSLGDAETAFTRGYNQGMNEGYENGYEAGEGEGYRRGYTEGQNAVSDGSQAIMTLFGAITSVPSDVLNGLGSLTIWNTAIISILITFLIIAMVVWVIKRFI